MARQPITKHQKLHVLDLSAEKFVLTRPVWDDYVVPLSQAGRRGNSDPAWTQLGATALYVPGFSASASNEVFFTIQTPHAGAVGSKYSDNLDRNDVVANEIRFHVHWAPSSTHTGNVLWQLDYWASNRTTAFSAVTTIQKLATAGGVALVEQIDGFAAIDASSMRDSTCIMCRLARIGGDETDTFTGVALGLSADAHIPRSSLGSTSEYGGA